MQAVPLAASHSRHQNDEPHARIIAPSMRRPSRKTGVVRVPTELSCPDRRAFLIALQTDWRLAADAMT